MGFMDWLFGKKKKKRRRAVQGKRRPMAAQKRMVSERKVAAAKTAHPAAKGSQTSSRPQPIAIRPQASVPSIDYFESPRPTGDVACMHGECTCRGAAIAHGTGYLYISEDLVEYRRDARSIEAAETKASREVEGTAGAAPSTPGGISAALICESAAISMKLDLHVAAADARHWWETGMAPLRATPVITVVEEEVTVVELPAAPVVEKLEEAVSAEPVVEEPKSKASKPRTKKSTTADTKKKSTTGTRKKSTTGTRKKKEKVEEVSEDETSGQGA